MDIGPGWCEDRTPTRSDNAVELSRLHVSNTKRQVLEIDKYGDERLC